MNIEVFWVCNEDFWATHLVQFKFDDGVDERRLDTERDVDLCSEVASEIEFCVDFFTRDKLVASSPRFEVGLLLIALTRAIVELLLCEAKVLEGWVWLFSLL